MTLRSVAVILAAALALGGCAREIGGSTVDSSQIGGAVATERGVIESVRMVQVQEGDRLQDNLIGAGVGGLAGGVAGSRIGGGFGRTVATGAGAIAGAAVGAAAQQQLGRQSAVEYVVRLSFGRLVTVVQADAQPLPVGAAVFVQTGQGQRARVIPA